MMQPHRLADRRSLQRLHAVYKALGGTWPLGEAAQ